MQTEPQHQNRARSLVSKAGDRNLGQSMVHKIGDGLQAALDLGLLFLLLMNKQSKPALMAYTFNPSTQ